MTRGYDGPVKLEWIFRINDYSEDGISHIENHEVVNEIVFEKRQNGEISVKLDQTPSHDLSPREELAEGLQGVNDFQSINESVAHNTRESISANIEATQELLSSEELELPLNELQILNNLEKDLKTASDAILNEDDEIPEEYEDEAVQLDKIIEDLRELEQSERNCPARRVKNTLLNSRPSLLQFTQEERNLSSTYNLEEEAIGNPPPELGNLLRLAGLDLRSYYDAIEDYEPDAQHQLNQANEKLREVFSQIWVREEVVPVLAKDKYLLHIHVSQEGEGGLSRIGERSDGLSWFVALRAFLAGKDVESPIILVDEIETHLSYDAQAMLTEYLETEVLDFSQKVVYTTHSAGALPSDVGRGIRSVERVENGGERSTIKNGFWADRDAGFSPMLLAMGLSPFAFSIPRNALITEGPSDCILLPELIRESADEDKLPYQVAPGASWVDTETVPELISESANSVLIFDSDSESEQLINIFREAGVDEELMRTYDDFTTEDDGIILENLVKFDKLITAINEEISFWEGIEEEVDASDIDSSEIWESLEAWCESNSIKRPRKIGVAQRLITMAAEENGETIVSMAHEETLVALHDWAVEHFHVPDR